MSGRPDRPELGSRIAQNTDIAWIAGALGVLVIFLVMFLANTARAVEFPGPVIHPQDGASLCGHRVRLPGKGNDYFISGSSTGFLNLNRYNPVSRSFLVLHRFFVGGEVVSVTPWLGRPLGEAGFVVATSNPDRILLVEVASSFPYLSVEQAVELSEDPGDLTYVGNDAIGPWEIAVALPGVDEVVFLGENAGQWSVTSSESCGDDPASLVAIDLNGDDLKELVVASVGPLSQSIGIFRRQGNGERVLQVVNLPGITPSQLAAIDLDSDGRQELAVGAANSNTVVFYQTTNGDFVETERASLSIVAQSLHLTRLPDGSQGLLVANSDRGLVELLQRSAGQWQRLDTYYPGCRPWDFAFADLDGDAVDDVLTFGGSTEVLSVMLGNERPGFWGFPALSFDKTPGDFDRRDIDADGRDDLLVADANETTIRLFFGTEDGSLSLTPKVWDLGFIPGRVLAANMDADAVLELVALDIVNGKVVVLDWTDDGGLALLSSTAVGAFPFYVTSAFVDSDLHRDLIVLTQTENEVNVVFGQGDGTISEVVRFGFGSRADRILALDLNADNRLDLVATDGQSRVWSVLNQGNRTFGNQSFVNAGSGALYLAAGDLDGDGDQDVVVANRTEQSLSFFDNNSAGLLIRRIGGFALPSAPAGLVLADFDLDNRLDVLTNFQIEGTLGLVFGVANWSYSQVVQIDGGPNMYAVAAADFNLDGVPDILTLDRSLRLGLTFLNVDPKQVSVEPTAFATDCQGDGLTMEIRPDRPGPWQLELGHDGIWQAVVTDGQVEFGTLDFERGVWYLGLRGTDLRDWGRYAEASWQARLTVGEGEQRESAVWSLVTDCLTQPVADLASLAWQEKPFPNPFNPTVRASFRLGRSEKVSVAIFNVAGRRVRQLIDGELPAGEHSVRWDGQAKDGVVSAGAYFFRIETAGQVITQKVVLIK